MKVLIAAIVMGMFAANTTWAFIERLYTVQEVVAASTNILVGRVETVDRARQRIVVDIHRNLKGESPFLRIRINAAVGQFRPGQSTPEMLLEKVHVDDDAIVFYTTESHGHGASHAGLVYVKDTWFQIFAHMSGDPDQVWWNFSHLEIFMSRTHTGDVATLKKLVEGILTGEGWPDVRGLVRVLMLTGNGAAVMRGISEPPSPVTSQYIMTHESAALAGVRMVGKQPLFLRATKDTHLPGLESADVAWIGYRELWRNGQHIDSATEERLRAFVRDGGVVVVSGQDYDDGRSLSVGWIPVPIRGVELNRVPTKATGDLGELLREPNAIEAGRVVTNDAWTGLSDAYEIVLKTSDGRASVVACLRHGKGAYLLTALDCSSRDAVDANTPLIQNLLHHAVQWSKR